MKNISCCYTGHRDIPYEAIPVVYEKVLKKTEELINRGFRHFYTGGAVGFDMIALEALTRLKEVYPDIFIHIIVPCEGHTRYWGDNMKEKFSRLSQYADEVKCLSPFYFDGCMQVRNRYLVEHSCCCIAYLERKSGGSAYTVSYAQRSGLTVINIAEDNN